MHCWPAAHSVDEMQSWAEPIVASAVAGTQAPGATAWHAVFADVVDATPQHTPDPEQSTAARHENPAVKKGHEAPWSTHVPPPVWSTQQVLVFRLQL